MINVSSIKWLSDDPIDCEERDKLSFTRVANIFSKMIIECDTPFTIGINGEWGSGKTSLMKLIKSNIDSNTKLDAKSKICTSWFNSWNFANENEIWKLLMISLIQDLDSNKMHEVDVEKLLSSVFSLGEIAATAYATGGISLYANKKTIIASTKNLFDARKSKEEAIIKDKVTSIKSFRQDFEDLVNKTVGEDGRYVIFIDDLDRVTPNKAIDIIESVKTFLDCDKCVFVIGCDYNYLDACISHKYGNLIFNGRDYIEKIVQVTFEISLLNDHLFNIYVNENINKLFKTRDDFNVVSNLINRSIGRNPRKIKRLANLYSIVHNLNQNGLDGCLLLKLICFMQRWPTTYKRLLADFDNFNYTFNRYQTWALPIDTWDEFFGVDPSWYNDEDDYSVPSPAEEYEEYVKTTERIKAKIEEEINEVNRDDLDLKQLKRFLVSPPLFPHNKDTFLPYLSLVQSVDLETVQLIEEEVLNSLPSVDDIYDLVENVLIYFDGQEVEGRYFDATGKVSLPNKLTENDEDIPIKLPTKRQDSIGDWFYIIIDSKSDDKRILALIEKFDFEKHEVLWLISPWGFPKTVKDFVHDKPNIYLSSYSLLEDLYSELQDYVVL